MVWVRIPAIVLASAATIAETLPLAGDFFVQPYLKFVL